MNNLPKRVRITVGSNMRLALVDLEEQLNKLRQQFQQTKDVLLGDEQASGTASSTISDAFMGLGCLGRSEPQEPVFVLVGRDQAAAHTVRFWANYVEQLGGAREKIEGARQIASEMDAWRERHGGGKVPD